jgi:hypothetical protein
MPVDHEITRPGYFHWNAGGWFGSQLGGTAWLLVGAAVLAQHAPAMTVVWIGCFAVANAVGFGLWHCRARLRPHTGIQLLLLTCGVAGFLAWWVLDTFRSDVVRELNWPRQGHWLLLLVPAMMGWFAVVEYLARGRPPSPEDAEPTRQ